MFNIRIGRIESIILRIYPLKCFCTVDTSDSITSAYKGNPTESDVEAHFNKEDCIVGNLAVQAGHQSGKV